MKRKIIYICNIVISLLLYPFFKLFYKHQKTIIMFGFGNDYYENNIRFLYEYYTNKMQDKYDIYAVFGKDSKQKQFIKNNLLLRGKIKTYLLFYISKAIIFDTCNNDIAPGIQRFWKKSKKIFLTHGMEGLKNVDFLFNNTKTIKADLSFAASEYEKNIRNKFGLFENTVVTGYPRFDFYNYADTVDKKIVILFTWRKYLSEDKLEESLYFQKVKEFLLNQDFINFLHEKNVKCYVKIHHKVINNIKIFNVDSNLIISQDFDFSKVLSESSLLITDYSSLAWDFIYYDKPVIFYQFDKEEYEEKSGKLYTNIENEKIGFSLKNINDIKNILNKCYDEARNCFAIQQIDNKTKFFNYIDNNNTQRVVQTIEDFLL